MTATAIAATIGRNDGPGMWTPGGGSDVDDDGQRRARGRRGRSRASPRGPSRGARGSAPRSRRRAMTGPNTSPSRTRNTPTAPKIGANDGTGQWTPGGGAGRIRPRPRCFGPSVRGPPQEPGEEQDDQGEDRDRDERDQRAPVRDDELRRQVEDARSRSGPSRSSGPSVACRRSAQPRGEPTART